MTSRKFEELSVQEKEKIAKDNLALIVCKLKHPDADKVFSDPIKCRAHLRKERDKLLAMLEWSTPEVLTYIWLKKIEVIVVKDPDARGKHVFELTKHSTTT